MYGTTDLPLGSLERARAQLEKLDLRKALRTCRNGHIPLASIKPELMRCFERLYAQNRYGVILSGYYEAGAIGPYTVHDLLHKMFEVKDFPSFLKQAYRFDAYHEFADEIDAAIAWHVARKLPDAEAWRRKFAKLREQEHLRTRLVDDDATIEILDENDVETNAPPTIFQLTPLKATRTPRQTVETEQTELPGDPYIISQTARAKTEKANILHRQTLIAVRLFLEAHGIQVSESKLIDAYAVFGNSPAIFEIKSISESNERDQIRHAISQLYEYRFLHSVPNASLWVVFSQEPSSQWYIDYLIKDRGMNVLWIQSEMIAGPSAGDLDHLCKKTQMTAHQRSAGS